jgi:hypothetical protein
VIFGLEFLQSAPLRAKEAVEDILDVLQVVLLDISADLEPISE